MVPMLCGDLQACYGLMWLTLGPGVVLAVSPTEDQMAQVGEPLAGTCHVPRLDSAHTVLQHMTWC